MSRIFLLLPILCAACGTFQLASSVAPPQGKTADGQRLDILDCKEQARMEAQSAGNQAAEFFLGFTIIGAPAGYQMDHDVQRAAFSKCMTSRGYIVTPPT